MKDKMKIRSLFSFHNTQNKEKCFSSKKQKPIPASFISILNHHLRHQQQKIYVIYFCRIYLLSREQWWNVRPVIPTSIRHVSLHCLYHGNYPVHPQILPTCQICRHEDRWPQSTALGHVADGHSHNAVCRGS